MAPRGKSGRSSLLARLSALFGFGGRKAAPKPPSAVRAPDVPDPQVEFRRKSIGMAMQTLRAGLKTGKVTQEEYAARVAELSEKQSG